ncbi:hypothetical protein SAMN06296036_110165 [Pseudobacteriovorax antillogorgiicola]|uniref:Uncharacterized protein n=2 Tax=Pseudobacteriovorax antillogorgiicola TaxID=1513793 RepID=A0A1Y6BYK7_9BACT|nr:hypothetical protein EDD56_113166 [Pseudobacteriovorax antillogorgiicola]SMF34817.1 hypothetical protein SAMN06296036_110165 [Pseudobacteriovorax antillogorgiicola]
MKLTLITFFTVSFLAGCGNYQADKSSTKFGVFSNASEYSLLPMIEKSGKIDFCVSFQGEDPSLELKEKVRIAAENAVFQWNGQLVGMRNPIWPHIQIESKVIFKVDDCDQFENRSVVKINLWKSEEVWISTFSDTKRSHARLREGTINLHPRYWTENQFKLEYVVLHEYAHLLGIGDTYHIAGRNTPDYQPASAMRTSGNPITSDDRGAIRALWKYLRTGQFSCGDEFIAVNSKYNLWQQNFCSEKTFVCEESRRAHLDAGHIDKEEYEEFRMLNFAPLLEAPGDPNSTINGWLLCEIVVDQLI